MKRLTPYLRNNVWRIVLLCLLCSVSGFASVMQALATRNFVDYAVAGSRSRFLLWIALFFGLILLQIFLNAIVNVLYESTTTRISNHIRRSSFSTVMSRDYASVKKFHSGDILQRVFADADSVAGNLVWIPLEVCSLTTKLVASVVYLTVLQWKLALILVICFFSISLLSLPLRPLIQQYHKRVMEKQGKARSFLQELMDNMLVVQSFQAVPGSGVHAEELLADYRKARVRKSAFSAGVGVASSLVVNAAYLIGLGWCGLGIVKGTISFGTLSAVWQLVGQITDPAKRATKILPQYYAMTASAERLQELEQIPPEKVDPATDWNAVSKTFSQIQLRDISFAYPGPADEGTDILNHLDLNVHSGDFIAITGQSGIGKSTLLRLILGVFLPNSGTRQILWGSGRVSELDAGARAMIAYVPQGNFLMSGTIRDAIHFWKDGDPDSERMEQACRIAEVSGFLSQLPRGLDTELGERGVGLSEGQLQRIALARAIYSGKPVLLLDEATSALDEETEAKVLENLRQCNDRTVIIVTHRKAALNICNRIVEMENGRIREHHDTNR